MSLPSNPSTTPKMKSSSSSTSDVTLSSDSRKNASKNQEEQVQKPSEERQTPETAVEKIERGEGKVEEKENKSEGPSPPYSLFTVNPFQKWMIVFLASIASFLSPVSGSIYLPVIPTIATDLMTTEANIILTVTYYQIVQGVAPLFLGSSTDTVGRKPIYLFCLIVYLGSTAGLANVPDSYVGLVLLRCVQAAGSSSLISIGAGVISDITTVAERGSVYGLLLMGNTIGSALGPLLGGLIAQGFSWRGIFWFLFIIGALALTLIVFFQPETLRKLVGNGSKPAPTLVHEAVFHLIRGTTVTQKTGVQRPGLPKDEVKANMTFPQRCWRSIVNIFAPFVLLKMPEMTLALLGYALGYTGWYMLISSLSTTLSDTYELSTLQIGLVYLAPGAGSAIGAFVNGRVLDRDYQRVKSKYQGDSNIGKVDGSTTEEKLGDFPLEKARLQSFPYLILGYICSTVAYGFLVEYKVHIAGPIIFTFFSTYCQQGIMSTFGTMCVDYKPSKGASATSLNNIFKCLLGAAGTAVIPYMIDGIGAGFAYLIVAIFVSLTVPIVLVLLKKGGKWRTSRG